MLLEDIIYFLIMPIVCVIIGAIAVYFSSIKILEKEQNIKIRNIANAFLLETKAIENYLLPTVNDVFLENHPNPSIFHIESHARNKLHWHYPFYDNYDLFSTSRMSIFILDEKLCEKMNKFYANLIISDDWRKEFMEKVDKIAMNESVYLINSPSDELKNIINSYSDTLDAVKHTFEPIEDIKKGLEEIISMNEKSDSIIKFLKKDLKEDMKLYSSDPFILFWSLFGVLAVISGAILLNQNPPIYQTGFPSITLGFAFFTFGSNRYSNAKMRRKLDEIENNLIEKLKKMDDSK